MMKMDLRKKRKDLNVVLYYHNDPRTMKGSILKSDREWLLKNLKGIICVSDYIKNCFLDNLNWRASYSISILGSSGSTSTSSTLSSKFFFLVKLIPPSLLRPSTFYLHNDNLKKQQPL